jgi:hypothetical protein
VVRDTVARNVDARNVDARNDSVVENVSGENEPFNLAYLLLRRISIDTLFSLVYR